MHRRVVVARFFWSRLALACVCVLHDRTTLFTRTMVRPTSEQSQALASLFSSDPAEQKAREAADAERERVRVAIEHSGLDAIMSYEEIAEVTRPEPEVLYEEDEPPPPRPKAPKAPRARVPVPAKQPIAKGSKARVLANRSRGGASSSSAPAADALRNRHTELINTLLGGGRIDVRSYAKSLMQAMRSPGARVAFAAAARPRIDDLD